MISSITMGAKRTRRLCGGLSHCLGIHTGFSVGFICSHVTWSLQQLCLPLLTEQEGALWSWFCVNSSYNAEIHPCFILTRCPAWLTAVVTWPEWRHASIPWGSAWNVELAQCPASVPQFLCVCLLSKAFVKGYRHQLLAQSDPNPMHK